MVNNKQIRQLAEQLKQKEYDFEYIGIRVQEEIGNSKIGYIVRHKSNVWDDGNMLRKKLNGVCAIDINNAKMLSNVDYNGYMGNIILVLGCNEVEYGEDAGEIIMQHAKILDIIKVNE